MNQKKILFPSVLSSLKILETSFVHIQLSPGNLNLCKSGNLLKANLKISSLIGIGIFLFPLVNWSTVPHPATGCKPLFEEDRQVQEAPPGRQGYIHLHEVRTQDLKNLLKNPGWTLQQIQNMTITEVEKIKLEEIRRLDTYHLRVLSLEQLRRLTTVHIQELRVDQLQALTLQQILYGLTRDQIHAMTPEQREALEIKLITSQQKQLFRLKLLSKKEVRNMSRSRIPFRPPI